MFAIPWYAVIFISIPETLLIISIGFSLFNIRLDIWKAVFVGVLIGLISYLFRYILLPPGIHITLLSILLTVTISYICGVKISYSFVAVLLGAMIIGIIDDSVTHLIFHFTSKTVHDLAFNPWLNIKAFLPTFFIGALLLLMIKKFQFVLYDLG